MTSTYGRQWFNPIITNSFNAELIYADKLAQEGNSIKAIKIYKKLANQSVAAQKRLLLAKRQAKYYRRGANLDRRIRIGHIDWYKNFTLANQFIKEILDSLNIDWEETACEHADLIIAGCYGDVLRRKQELLKDKLVLFVSGENLQPSYDIHDFSITTNPDTYCGKNARYPQWYSELTFTGDKARLRYNNLKTPDINRDLCISVIYNNATPQREELIYKLKKEFGDKSVHIYGSQRGGEIDKFEILARSKINMCFENSIQKGYVTEKLLHALSFGCKALYWGDMYYVKDFKTKGVFNAYESNLNDTVRWCREELAIETNEKIRLPIGIGQICEGEVSLVPIKKHISQWIRMIYNFRRLSQ